MRRQPTTELLDEDAGTAQEIEDSLRDLRGFNSRLGGVTTTRSLIENVARRARRNALSILEVASGEGFVPRRVADELSGTGLRLQTTLLDRSLAHLPKNGYSRVVGDALTLPFGDCSYDVVASSLFVHHLSPEQVVQFARESLRVSRVCLLINDLVRNPLHLAFAYAGVPLYRSRLTRHDAPASVKQAYTIEEMRRLLQEAGAPRVEIQRHFFFRMGVIAWKRV
jgi:hypothetical protein